MSSSSSSLVDLISSYCTFSLWSHLPSVVGDRSFGVFDFDESVPSPSFLSLSALSPSLDSTWIVDIKELLRLWHFTFAFSQVFVFLLLWGGVRVGQTEKPNIQSWKWGKSWKRTKNISRNIYFGGVVAATTLSTKRDPEQWQQQHDLDFVCLWTVQPGLCPDELGTPSEMEVAPRYELLTQRESNRAIMPVQCTFNIAILLYGLQSKKEKPPRTEVDS